MKAPILINAATLVDTDFELQYLDSEQKKADTGIWTPGCQALDHVFGLRDAHSSSHLRRGLHDVCTYRDICGLHQIYCLYYLGGYTAKRLRYKQSSI